MAAGKVTTGFSLPYVAKYAYSGSVSYTSGQKLARGVNVTITPTTNNAENNFYADNQLSESASGGYNGATFSLEVDGLKVAAQRLIYGLSAAGGDGFTDYNDSAVYPYCGVGFVVRQQEEGVVSFMAIVIPKARFDYPTIAAATQEQEIDWQTQTLTGTIFKSDGTGKPWLRVGASYEVGTTYTTEALAEAQAENDLKTALGITSQTTT